MSAPAYDSYKESGVEWVGDIPTHWMTEPLWTVAEECDRPNVGMIENNLLSLSYGRIVQKDVNNNDGLLPASFETYQIVEPDDVVWRLTDLQNDKRSLRTARVPERGIITSAYLATRPHRVSSSYFSYLLRAYDLMKVFYSMGGGLRQGMKFSDVRHLPILLPPPPEQTTIASFLDRETGMIDMLIDAQTRLIERLKEKHQAVVSHAVTKGLDAAAPMKDSGVEWLGQVPAHWNVCQLKHLVFFQRGHDLPAQDRRAGDIPIYSSGGLLDYHDEAVACGPAIVTGRYGSIGEFTLVNGPYWPLNTALYSIELPGNPAFTRYVLESLRPLFLMYAAKSAVPGVDRNDVHRLLVAIPDLDEQKAIADNLDQQSAQWQALLDAAQAAIALLQERRAALISAAVTGKIDVRGLAPKRAEAA